MAGKHFLFVCVTFIWCSAARTENGFESNGKCSALCSDFVSFIYETIQQKSLFSGLMSQDQLYSFVKRHASDFCKSRSESQQCKKFEENTWMIVAALEFGANVDDVCSHLSVCKGKEKETADKKNKDSKRAFQPFIEFCAEFYETAAERKEMCAKFSTMVHTVAGLIETGVKGGNIMQELVKCSPKDNSVGCYLKKAPTNAKLSFALANSMVPSLSKLKANIYKKIPQPVMKCEGNAIESIEVDDLQAKKIPPLKSKASQNWKVQCQNSCPFLAKSLLSGYAKEYKNYFDFKQQFQIGCQLMNLTLPEKCEIITSIHLPRLLSAFSTIVMERVCPDLICESEVASEMVSNKKVKCGLPPIVDEISQVGAVSKHQTGGGQAIGATTWFTSIMVLLTVAIAW